MAGVQETKEVVELAAGIGAAVAGALEDGKISLDDLAYLMAFMPKVGPAFDKIDQVPAELGDLDTAEAAEVVDLIKMKMPDITDDARAQAIVADSLGVALAAAKLVATIRS